MAYVGERVVHDADSHVMESPGWLLPYLEPDARERVGPLWMRGLGDFAEHAIAAVRDEDSVDATRRALERDPLDRKNWWALGASDAAQRSRVLDTLGFHSQLVFSTHSGRSLPTDPGLVDAVVSAHNRALAAFCADDERLLAVAWVPLDDPGRVLERTTEAIELGCAAVEVPSRPTGPLSPTHVDFEPFYTLLESHRAPLIFHLGSGGEIPNQVFAETGRPTPVDPDGNVDPLRRLRTIGLVGPAEVAVAALVFDGVLERHPGLRVGVIEQGASWVPGFLRRLDLAVDLDRVLSNESEMISKLTLPASEYVLRQVRFTPFPMEPLAWILAQSDPRLYLFSSDFPHAEGDRDPVGRFDAELSALPEDVSERFYRLNFEDLMGRCEAPTR